jgi:hypothetical protein
MHVRDVPEDKARNVSCPQCLARRGYACQSTGLGRGSRNRMKQRACMGRRRAWLERNSDEETKSE